MSAPQIKLITFSPKHPDYPLRVNNSRCTAREMVRIIPSPFFHPPPPDAKMNVSSPPAGLPLTPQPQTYPAVNPYPPAQSAPSTGPGSGFPPKSGLAGMTPHSMSSTPIPNMAPGAGMRGGLPEERNVAQLVRENTNVWARKWQGLLDRSTPHVLERWLVTLGLFLLFALNVILRQGVSSRPHRPLIPQTRDTGADMKDHSGTLSATPLPSTSSTCSSPFSSLDSTPRWPKTWLRMMSKRVLLVCQVLAPPRLRAD